MKTQSLLHKLAINTILPLALSLTAQAQTVMLDFGPTVTSLPDVAPYVATDGNAWTQVLTANGSYDDVVVGSLTLKFGLGGQSSANGWQNLIDFSQPVLINSNALGAKGNLLGSLFADGTAGRDGIFTGNNNDGYRTLGVQISGLAAGTYDLYLTGFNTNQSSPSDANTFYVSTAAALGASGIDYTSFDSEKVNYVGTVDFGPSITTWTDGSNYAKFTVTLGAGDTLTLLSIGSADENRGFLNSLQIIQIPEPSIWFLLVGGGGVLLPLIIMRRRQQPQA
jgi:hypothetical protein